VGEKLEVLERYWHRLRGSISRSHQDIQDLPHMSGYGLNLLGEKAYTSRLIDRSMRREDSHYWVTRTELLTNPSDDL